MCFFFAGVRGFIEACKGQSVAGIGKKGKDGKFRLKDSTTCQQFCDSFRYSTRQPKLSRFPSTTFLKYTVCKLFFDMNV